MRCAPKTNNDGNELGTTAKQVYPDDRATRT